jgi:cytochrome c556
MAVKTCCISALVAAALLLATPAAAQLTTTDASIRHRKAALTLMNTYFTRIYQATHGERPYVAEEVLDNARRAEHLSKLPWEGFGAGTDRGDTRAKVDIWFEPERFRQYAENMQAEMTRLREAAQGGEPGATKAAFVKARETCQTCHKAFRAD